MPDQNAARLRELLAHTSRTFAIAIPLLPEPEACEVGLAYLLLRVADTIEDSTIPAAERVELLDVFAAALEDPAEPAGRELVARASRPDFTANAWYRALTADTPLLLAELERLAPVPRRIIVDHCLQTTRGMRSFVGRGELTFRTERELRDYCYVVAGLVGELLTELFLHHAPQLTVVREALTARAKYFGEALQLTNILKDAADDRAQGRHFLGSPALLPAAFRLAESDLQAAREYYNLLAEHHAPPGYLAFTRFPVELAAATLEQVRLHGAGAKVDREMVQRVLREVQNA